MAAQAFGASLGACEGCAASSSTVQSRSIARFAKMRSSKGKSVKCLVASAVAALLLAIPVSRLAYVPTEAEAFQRRQELHKSLVKAQAKRSLKMKDSFLAAKDRVAAQELDHLLATVKEASPGVDGGRDFSMDEIAEALRLYRGAKTQTSAAPNPSEAEDLKAVLKEIIRAPEMAVDPAVLAERMAAKAARLDRLKVNQKNEEAAKQQRMASIFQSAIQNMGSPYHSPAPPQAQVFAAQAAASPVAAPAAPAAAAAPVAGSHVNTPQANRIKELLANPALPQAARQSLLDKLAGLA